MKRVIIESPYAGDVKRNLRYARAAMKDCLNRGEAPYASHLLYTQKGVLDDSISKERKLGIEAGLTWGEVTDLVVVYEDLGITEGMKYGIEKHEEEGREIEYRSLSDWSLCYLVIERDNLTAKLTKLKEKIKMLNECDLDWELPEINLGEFD